MLPKTQYTRSGDLHIAYQVVGEGQVDLVYVPGWVSHVELAWEEPTLARFLRRLASFSRLIMFDKRGTGLSDRVPNDRLPTLEERIDDLRAVMDAVGSERASVFGVSEGGNLSAFFAATYPERTKALVLFGTFAKRIWSSDYPWAPKAEDRAGVHTGEVDITDHDIGGIAVHIAARVVAAAQPGEVLVSSTVKDLSAGSGINFTERGAYALKGVPDKWRLFAVTR
jgi:pimeloyl-ACP methyl ester carboxylesterase